MKILYSILTNHTKFVHEGKNQPKFTCAMCDKQFTHKDSLRKHTEATHEGMLYGCKFCQESFKSEYILKGHIDFVHKSDKEGWKCDLCKHPFKAKPSLVRHIKNVHGEEKDPLFII